MGASILSLDSMRGEGTAVHGSIHSLIGFNEKGGPPTLLEPAVVLNTKTVNPKFRAQVEEV